MNDEPRWKNPIDSFVKIFIQSFLDKHKGDKKIINLKSIDYSNLQFNKNKDLLIYKNSIGDKYSMRTIGVFYFSFFGLTTTTFSFIRFSKLNYFLRVFYISLNFLLFSEAYYSYKRLKDVRSIYLHLPDTITVKTNDSRKYKMNVNEIVNISQANEELYTFISKGIYDKTNEFYFFMIQDPVKRTSYLSPLFNNVMVEGQAINLI